MSAELAQYESSVQTVPEGLLLKRQRSIGYFFVKEVDENRRPAAGVAAADLQTKFKEGERLLDCRPVIYRETFGGEVVEGTGALVLRCTVDGPDGLAQRNLWINDDHRAGLQESTITFAGMIANEGFQLGHIWEVTHLTEHSVQSLRTPGRDAFPLASVSTIRPAGEGFADLPQPRTGTEG